jgi:UDP-2,3-diacylglucosamine pyrophosphatase LpxH
VTPFPPPVRVPGGVAVFADAHLGQADRDADDFLEELSAVRRRGLSTIVFLGDIFHYFIGDAKFETPLVQRVLAAWRDLATSGASLRYVEGNRDFYLDGTRFVSSFAAFGEADGLDIGGVRYAFVHGDRVNTRDLPYRFWRRFSKNPVSRRALTLIPGPLARAIVAEAERRLYRTNFRHKSFLPEAELLAEGRRARRAGYERLLVGHFHVERLLEAPDGITHVLPAWLEERKHAEIDATGRLAIVEEASAARAVKRRADLL